jgi:Lanthionine synthetase C-like protein
MLDHARHVPLQPLAWTAAEACSAIDEIVSDTLNGFDERRFWPSHPLEDGLPDGHPSLYAGATGVIWALQYLERIGATESHFDFRPVLPRLIAASTAQFANGQSHAYAKHGSFLLGDMGTALLAMRLAPRSDLADLIKSRATANMELPIRGLMWGMPGSMLVCIHMAAMTSEAPWKTLFSLQASRLLDELEDTVDGPLWTQDLHGRHHQFLGALHGYAGNMIPLIHGWNWLSAEQRSRITDAIPQTLAANARRSNMGASWRAIVGHDETPVLCQHCHGAPGMVTTFADAPFSSPDLDKLLADGGYFAWTAGPLAKGSNLCHGTGGMGYAFLKLYRRTKDPVWIDRARAFAMTAINQCRAARKRYGRGRYSLWTGDVGLAIYLWDCVTGEPRFPTIDVF